MIVQSFQSDRGALMAVDADGVLRGVVTIDQVRRALSAALPQRLAKQ